MAAAMKRFTVSVTDEMEVQPDRIKQAKYYNSSQSRMVQNLIVLGINAMIDRLNVERNPYAIRAEPTSKEQ